MPVDSPFTVYRDQLSALSHGLALWNPDPLKTIYNKVSIGDVGYMCEGTFIRMFNVTLPSDHPSNGLLGYPEPYDPLDWGPFTNTIKAHFDRVDHYSRSVTAETSAGNLQAMTTDDVESVTYKFRNRKALLSLPNGGHREDVICTKVFEDYIRDHVDTWFNWAQKNRLGVDRMEDLILVSGCTMVTSWAAAACVDNTLEAEISLASRALSNAGASFVWSNVRGPVLFHNSRFDPQNPPTMEDQCVFIRGFRAKRIFFWTRRIRATAEPRSDDLDNYRGDEMEVSGVPGAEKNRDPLVGVLDYIAEKCQSDDVEEGILAIAHHGDLQLIEDLETMTADAIQKSLHEEEMPLLVENGAAILHDPAFDGPPISDGAKTVFYAAAGLNGEPNPLVIHPALTKYNIKLEMNESADHDYGLPIEEMNSLAVYPPVLSLKLESYQGYPQIITAEASSDTQGVGVTVQDVLRTLHENLRMKFPRRELSKLDVEERAGMDVAFRERCKTGEELSKGPRRIDLVCGRDRLQILPKFELGPNGSGLVPTSTISALRTAGLLDESSVAGPSRNPIH